MPVSRFLQYGPAPHSPVDAFSNATAIQEAAQTIQGTSTPRHFLVGTVVQEPGIYQIISEGPDDIVTGSESSTIVTANTQGVPRADFRVAFDTSLFITNGPATGNVVEYVQHFFPASKATQEFKRQIERDFVQFIEGFSEGGVQGRLSWTFGWTLEDASHAEIDKEKAKSFVIVVGWESMEAFERSIQREAFRSSLPILLAWKAPYKMWHSERKASL